MAITIKLNPKHKIDNLNISCVYRIWFGDKYYIGRSKNLGERMRCHAYDLNRHLYRYEDDGTLNMFYQHIIKQVVDNNITVALYEVLDLCKDEDERVRFEQSWFNMCCDDTNCLNYGFESFPYTIKPPAKHLTNKQRISMMKKTLKSIK